MNSPLRNLHQTFHHAFHHHLYIGSTRDNFHPLESTTTKNLRMAEVFKRAREQIEETLQGKPCQSKDVVDLKTVAQEGRKIYERYIKSTDTIGRWILKKIAYYTPQQLKPWLPFCFSNGLEKAERAVLQEFKQFQDLITNSLDEEKIQVEINQHLETIRKSLSLMSQIDRLPLSLQKMKKTLKDLTTATSALIHLDLHAQTLLRKWGLKDPVLDVLQNHQLRAALDSNHDQKILELLQETPWQASFKEALTQSGHIKFVMQKLENRKFLRVVTDKGVTIKDPDSLKYRGEIAVTLVDTQALDVIESLIHFLDKNTSCCPCSLTISIQGAHFLTPTLLNMLMRLKDRIAEIKIEGLKEIDFRRLALSSEEEHLFIQHLSSFHFPQIQKIALSSYLEEHGSARDFSQLLAACPTMEMLKVCYQHCSSYREMQIPPQLAQTDRLDLRDYPIDKIPHLLAQCPQCTHLNLSGLPITNAHLIQWLTPPHTSPIKGLELEGCPGLNTDILIMLAKMPHLTSLSLPNLPRGGISIDKLPKSDNPFKIHLLYTTSRETQAVAPHLYTGPKEWAAVFQIPLARHGLENLFPVHHTLLDSTSVAYWLYQEDYRYLRPQVSITTVLADCNAGLRDDNLVEFMQKFPQATTLSLYQCPNVTAEGIIRLLKTCPHIRNLDLTGCPQINESLLLSENHQACSIILGKAVVERSMPIPIDPHTQTLQCINYQLLKQRTQDLNLEELTELKRLAACYLHHRIVVGLFGYGESAQQVIAEPIDPKSQEYCDFTLSFKTDAMPQAVEFSTHRNIVYGQSPYFITGFRVGGKFSKETGLIINNAHATAEAGQAIIDIFYGKPSTIENLNWETAAHVAELLGPQNFNLPSYQALLDRINSQFDLDNAYEILVALTALEEEGSKAVHQITLMEWLNHLDRNSINYLHQFRIIANIAKTFFEFDDLGVRVREIESEQSQYLMIELLQQEIREQNRNRGWFQRWRR